MCRVDDGDYSQVWVAKVVKARKIHTCIECFRTIEKRETYETVSSLYDGHWSRLRTCEHCLAARSFLEIECGGYVPREVAEEIEEHFDEGDPYRTMRLARLIIGMRRGWSIHLFL